MNRRTRQALSVAAAAAVGIGCWWGWSAYSGRRRALDAEIVRYREGLDAREVELADAPRLRKRFDELADISLGASEEEANAVLRRALNEMAAHVGLRRAQVSTSTSRPQVNPATRSRLREFRAREVRERPDFHALSATLTGECSLEQAVRTIALLNAQPWVCRIDGVGLRVLGRERESVDLSVTITGVFVRGGRSRSTDESAARIWSPIDDAAIDPWRAIVAKNVFREPPAPPRPPDRERPVVEAPPPPPPPAAPSLADWRITAVVQSPSGPELWIVNTRSGETRTLAPGAEVLGATFVTGSGEVARIRIGEDVFEVRLGSTLAERKSVS